MDVKIVVNRPQLVAWLCEEPEAIYPGIVKDAKDIIAGLDAGTLRREDLVAVLQKMGKGVHTLGSWYLLSNLIALVPNQTPLEQYRKIANAVVVDSNHIHGEYGRQWVYHHGHANLLIDAKEHIDYLAERHRHDQRRGRSFGYRSWADYS